MIIHFLLALVNATSGAQSGGRQITPPEAPVPVSSMYSPGGSYILPSAMAPMANRYQSCLTDANNRNLRETTADGSQTSAQLRALPAKAVEECASVRVSAFGEADLVLRRTYPKAAKRTEMIEGVFSYFERSLQGNADHMVSMFEAIRRRHAAENAAPTEVKSNAKD